MFKNGRVHVWVCALDEVQSTEEHGLPQSVLVLEEDPFFDTDKQHSPNMAVRDVAEYLTKKITIQYKRHKLRNHQKI